MKIIKHCHEEGTGNSDVAHGVLLGLVNDDKLEVTNCFPFPKNADDNDTGKLAPCTNAVYIGLMCAV